MARTYRSQAQWLAIIDEYKRSDQTQTAFCANRGLNPKYFSLKRSKLARQSAVLPESTSGFIRMAPPSSAGIKVRIGAVCLELPADYPLDALSRLINTVA